MRKRKKNRDIITIVTHNRCNIITLKKEIVD